MKNPFDQTFFRFLLGFSFILASSFLFTFIAWHYGYEIDEQKASISKAKI